MTVVPYNNNNNKIENQEIKYLTDLDKEMSSILSNNKLSDDEKIKLYQQALNKYNNKFDLYSQPAIGGQSNYNIPITTKHWSTKKFF